MGITGVLTTFAVSTVLAAYLFYALVPVPPEIEPRDDVFWIFAKQKYIRSLSIIGEFLGFGHRLQLSRQLSSLSMLQFVEPADYTGITVNPTHFDGIPVRLYEPVNRVSNGPGLIWIHGGGWTSGSAESDDFIAAELSRRLGILVVSIDYRLAPEYPFPVPFDDCVKATIYFVENSHQMNVDSARIAIAGSSAGANLATAVSLKLRDIGSRHRPSVQVLMAPCLQAFDFNTPSYQRDMNNAFLPSYWMASHWLWYARGVDGHQLADVLIENGHTSATAKVSDAAQRVDHNLVPRKYIDATYGGPSAIDYGDVGLWAMLAPTFLDPYFAPLMATDLSLLPTTLVMTAERDVLRDDGIMFARRLASAGVAVEHKHYEHGYHLLILYRQSQAAALAINDMVDFLSKRL